MRRIYYLVATVITVTSLLIWWQAPNNPNTSTAHLATHTTGTPADQETTSIAATVLAASKATDNNMPFVSGLENLPHSLHDTDVDGGFTLDADGNLIVTHRIRQLFDYFLSAQGEEPLPTIVRRLRAYIHNNLAGDAAVEAEQLLESYINYLNDVATLDSAVTPGQAIDLTQLRSQKDQLAAIRAGRFDATANDAFFAEEEAYDLYTIARLEMMQDDSLTADQRARQLAALEQQLPPELQESLRDVTRYQDLQVLTQQWQTSDGNTENLQKIRENLVGREAAERLATLDRERAEWQQRVDNWLQERQSILASSSLSEEDRKQLIQRRRTELFDPQEQLRIETLEQGTSE